MKVKKKLPIFNSTSMYDFELKIGKTATNLMLLEYIPYTSHCNPWLVYFGRPFFAFKEFFSENSVLVSIQEGSIIKSGLWWSAYGSQFLEYLVQFAQNTVPDQSLYFSMKFYKTYIKKQFKHFTSLLPLARALWDDRLNGSLV